MKIFGLVPPSPAARLLKYKQSVCVSFGSSVFSVGQLAGRRQGSVEAALEAELRDDHVAEEEAGLLHDSVAVSGASVASRVQTHDEHHPKLGDAGDRGSAIQQTAEAAEHLDTDRENVEDRQSCQDKEEIGAEFHAGQPLLANVDGADCAGEF